MRLLMLPVLLPLLLFQLMVATLLALQVEFGVLELSCQLLAFLLQLLRHPLHLLIVCLHVCQLIQIRTNRNCSEPFQTACQQSPFCLVKEKTVLCGFDNCVHRFRLAVSLQASCVASFRVKSSGISSRLHDPS